MSEHPVPLRQRLWSFFLWVAFPIHGWAIFIWLLNADQFARRALANAFGLGGYFLLEALLESLLLTGVFLALGLLLPRRWPGERRLAALSGLYLAVAGWALAGQAFWLLLRRMPERMAALTAPLSDNLWALVLLLALVAASLILPLWGAGRARWQRILSALQERVTLLSLLYLALDAIAVVVVLWRNL